MTSSAITVFGWLAHVGFAPTESAAGVLLDARPVTAVPEGSTAVLLAGGVLLMVAPQILRQLSGRRHTPRLSRAVDPPAASDDDL